MGEGMTPAELKQARHTLGLTLAQLAPLLDTDPRSLRRYEAPATASTAAKPPPRVGRLVTAYLAGYRPADWPANTRA